MNSKTQAEQTIAAMLYLPTGMSIKKADNFPYWTWTFKMVVVSRGVATYRKSRKRTPPPPPKKPGAVAGRDRRS